MIKEEQRYFLNNILVVTQGEFDTKFERLNQMAKEINDEKQEMHG